MVGDTVGDDVGDAVGGVVIAIVGDIVGSWALDLVRRRSKTVAVIELVMVVMSMVRFEGYR